MQIDFFCNLNKMASNLIKHICIFALFCWIQQSISFEKYDIKFYEISSMLPVIKVMEVICDIQFVNSQLNLQKSIGGFKYFDG